MSKKLIRTPYVHVEKGWPVVIAGGLGDSCWSPYLLKPNGSLQRCCYFKCRWTSKAALLDLRVYMTSPGRKFLREAA